MQHKIFRKNGTNLKFRKTKNEMQMQTPILHFEAKPIFRFDKQYILANDHVSTKFSCFELDLNDI